jgi:transposase
MARELVDDELWEIVQPPLPVRRRRKTHPGRKPLDDRRILTGSLFVLQSGIPWKMLPQEMGCGFGMTCWRRLRAWQKAGVWRKLHRVLLDKLRGADKLDCPVSLPTVCRHGLYMGEESGPNPTDRRNAGSRHHLFVDAQGIPVNVILTKANRHDDVTQLLPLVDGVHPIRGKRGRPLKKPKSVQADRAYDRRAHRLALEQRGIDHQIAKRRTAHGSNLGKTRWVSRTHYRLVASISATARKLRTTALDP